VLSRNSNINSNTTYKLIAPKTGYISLS